MTTQRLFLLLCAVGNLVTLVDAKKKKRRKAHDGSDDDDEIGTDHPMHPDNLKGGVGVGVGSSMVLPPWILYVIGALFLAVIAYVAKALLVKEDEGKGFPKGRKERKVPGKKEA